MKRIKLPLKGLSLFANVGIAEAYIKKYVDIKVANELVEKRAKFYSELYPSTCLLYTSPSPRDLSTSRMPSSA